MIVKNTVARAISNLFIQTVHASKFYFPSFSLKRKLKKFSRFVKNTAQSQFSLVKFSKYMIFFFFGTESLAKET